MPRATARSIALALFVLGALWSPATGSGRSLRASGFVASCKLPGDKLVEANRYARVYYNAEDEDIGICRPGKREPDFAPLAEAVYPRPAIDLVGPYLGYAATATEGQENVDIVAIVDVRSMDPRFITDLQGGVGSLRVNRRGSIAWIVCPNGSLSAGLHCGPSGPAFPPRSV